jgi:hypothetical protein
LPDYERYNIKVTENRLVQSAWRLARSTNGGVLGKKYAAWVNAKGKSKAIVALSRKLIEMMWVLATRKAIYSGCDPVKYNVKHAGYEIVNNREKGVA